ncbi:MAG: peptidoglycan-binding protein [Candidatus Pacebacteria bacterium]|nr:peptidoglycan-binding protein [Candidatus Paceibacterota bacterium]MDD5357344.1 peptidoglycan-binding protein [Candidatus Paceibacterota bacterium]
MANNKRFSKIASGLFMGTAVVAALLLVSPGGASAATLNRQLQLGMSGADVSALQAFLAGLPGVYPQGLVTGYFGPLTKAAVTNFQIRNGIPGVGRVGPLTLAVLNVQMNGNVGSEAPVIGPLSVDVGRTTTSISWNTRNNTSAILYYDTHPIAMVEASATRGVSVGGSSLLVNNDLRASHSANLSGLDSNTTYYFVVYVRDAFGNENITLPATFRTTN